VIAIAVADIHLSHVAPVARSAEPNWYKAMGRTTWQLQNLSDKYEAPLLYSGDIFHKWRVPPELINWAITHLPKGYGIPGQHDMPYHDLMQIEKSAYETLVKSGVITCLFANVAKPVGDMVLWGYPWQEMINDNNPKYWGKENNDGGKLLHVALIHAYCWKRGKSHPGAQDEDHVSAWLDRLHNYDLAFFGDNHQPFRKGNIINCGGLFRRNIDERDHEPSAWLIWNTGEVTRRKLDCSEDKFIQGDYCDIREAEMVFEASSLLADVSWGESFEMDFRQAARMHMDATKSPKRVRQIVENLMEAGYGE
jgi:hypothetical protein